ncbi:hypothetical protein MnTg01_01285 [archaeon MnTg01]|nr:hypothetical protein MnTg01_01285 [archaeon MnTg01]
MLRSSALPFARIIADNNGNNPARPPYAVFPSTNQNISSALESNTSSRIFLPISV